jgi:hypothetical protein
VLVGLFCHDMCIFCTEDAKARQIEERARGYMPKNKIKLFVASDDEILQETALHFYAEK